MSQHNDRLSLPRSTRPQWSPRTRQGPARVGLAIGAAALLAGCGAGQITQTDSQKPAVDGGSASEDSVVVNNAQLGFPEGDDQRYYSSGADVPLSVFVTNKGEQADELVSISTDSAGDVTIEGDTSVPAGRSLEIVEPGSAQAAESADSSDSSEDDNQAAVGTGSVVLNELEHALRPGQSVTLTMTFREAGSVEVLAPLEESPAERPFNAGEEISEGGEAGEDAHGE